MPKYVITDADVIYNIQDISGITNSATIDYNAEMQTTDNFGGNATRSRIPGLRTVSVTMSGYYDGDFESDLYARIGNATAKPISIIPEGNTVGNLAYTFDAHQSTFNPNGAVGDVFGLDIEVMSANAPLVSGRLFRNATETSSENSAGLDFAAVPTGGAFYAALHVLDSSGTGDQTLDVTVESDADGDFGTGATTQLTFTQVTTSATSQFLSVAGAITDTFWRFTWTVSGSGSPSFDVVMVGGVSQF